jgi:hypothetical protein
LAISSQVGGDKRPTNFRPQEMHKASVGRPAMSSDHLAVLKCFETGLQNGPNPSAEQLAARPTATVCNPLSI